MTSLFQLQDLKDKFSGWKAILAPLHKVLIWDKPFYPAVLAGAVTFVYLLFWYLEFTLLTTVSVIGIIVCILDYVVPIACSKLFDTAKWTDAQEKDFEGFCEEILCWKEASSACCSSLCEMKENKPTMYAAVLITSLVVMAWIGNTINNCFLTYLLTVGLVLSPGLKKNQVVEKHLGQVINKVKSLINEKLKKN